MCTAVRCPRALEATLLRQRKQARQGIGLGVAWSFGGPLLIGLGVLGGLVGIPSVVIGGAMALFGPPVLIGSASQAGMVGGKLRALRRDRGGGRSQVPARSRVHGLQLAFAAR